MSPDRDSRRSKNPRGNAVFLVKYGFSFIAHDMLSGATMAGLSVATITKAKQAVIAPDMQVVKDRLAAIEGELKSLRSEIRRLDDKIENLDKRLSAQITLLDEKFTFTNKRLDEARESRERLATLEAKVGR